MEAAQRHGLAIYAYVWMTNHIPPASDARVRRQHQQDPPIGRSALCAVLQFAYKRSGTLWEGRYRATVVDSERYLLTVMRYIELNSVRAGMVAVPQDYPWSSYRRNASGESGPNADWLVSHEEYIRLGREDAAR